MANWYEIGQYITLVLIGTSALMVATNATLEPILGSEIFASSADLNTLRNFVSVSDVNIGDVDQNLQTTLTSGQLNNPFAFITAASDSAVLVGSLIYALLTGWTVIINLVFLPYGLGLFGSVIIGILGAIEAYFIFRFFIIIASVIRGGGG